MKSPLSLRLGCILLFGLQHACALLSKSDTFSPRYFSPEPPTEPLPPRAAGQLELRLGQVSSASHLDERITYRLNAAEVGFYDDRRWTEIPEVYLRRALERELFERQGVQRIVTGSGPTLDIELTAMEELRGEPPRARVALSFSLRDERRALLERSISVEREVLAGAGADPAARLAKTLSAVLAEAVTRVGNEITAQLSATEPSATPSTTREAANDGDPMPR